MSEQAAAPPTPADTVALLSAAADVLRRVGRAHPRGPWRWGDPDVGDEPRGGPTPHREPWHVVPARRWPNPLDEPAPLDHRDPSIPVPGDVPPLRPDLPPGPRTVLGPAVAEPLAALLDLLAGQVEREEREVGPETTRAAVAVARSVLGRALSSVEVADDEPR